MTSTSRIRYHLNKGADSAGYTKWYQMSLFEVILCAIIMVLCTAIHFTSFYHAFALPIELILSFISFITPISGVLYLSATQVIPDVKGSPLPTAQMALLGFFFWQMLKGNLVGVFSSGRPLLISVAPFFIWNAIWALIHGDSGHLASILFFAVLTGCATAALVQESGFRLRACLVAFLAGQSLAMCLFWILRLNLGTPIEAFDYTLYGSSLTEGIRIGTSRGNSTMLGAPMALVLVGVCTLCFISTRNTKLNMQQFAGGLVWVACVIPPLIASGSRGAIVSAVCGVVAILITGIIKSWSIKYLYAFAIIIFIILSFSWTRLHLEDNWREITERQQTQRYEHSSIIGGRELEWKAALGGIMDSPLVGGGKIQILSFIGNESMWASHSTYLDAGLAGGLPGMVFFIWFILKPIGCLWQRRIGSATGHVLVIYITAAVLISYGSAMNAKFLWIIWGVAAPYILVGSRGLSKKRGLTTDRVTT